MKYFVAAYQRALDTSVVGTVFVLAVLYIGTVVLAIAAIVVALAGVYV